MSATLSRRKALTFGLGGLVGCAATVDDEAPSRTASQALTLPTGADPTGVTSSHAAFRCALEWLRDHGGGTLYVPRGRYTFTSPVGLIDFASGLSAAGVRVVGEGASTELCPVGLGGQMLFSFANANDRIVLDGLSFLGSGTGALDLTPDVGMIVFASYCQGGLAIQNCTFGGLRAASPEWGGLVAVRLTDLVVRGTHFNGCATEHGAIYAYDWKAVLIEDTQCLDFYTRNGVNHCKTAGGNSSWIHLTNSNGDPVNRGASEGTAILRSCRFDEGAVPQILIDPGDESRIERVLIEDCSLNVSAAAGGAGILARNVDLLTIRRTRTGYAPGGANPGLDLYGCDVAELEHVRALAGASVIRADAATQYLHLRDCSFGALDSAAAVTEVTTKGVTTRTVLP